MRPSLAYSRALIERGAEIMEVEPDEVHGKSRGCEDAVTVRRAVAGVLRERGWTLTKIARVLYRDHSSISHSIPIHWRWLESDADYRYLVAELRKLQPDC